MRRRAPDVGQRGDNHHSERVRRPGDGGDDLAVAGLTAELGARSCDEFQISIARARLSERSARSPAPILYPRTVCRQPARFPEPHASHTHLGRWRAASGRRCGSWVGVNVHPRGAVESRWTFAAIVGVNVHPCGGMGSRWTFAAIVGVNVHPCRAVGSRWTFASTVELAGVSRGLAMSNWPVKRPEHRPGRPPARGARRAAGGARSRAQLELATVNLNGRLV